MRRTKKKTLKGLTLYFCFGSYNGFSLKFRGSESNVPFRISLGWISITVLKWDLENFFEKLMHEGVKVHKIVRKYKKESYNGE